MSESHVLAPESQEEIVQIIREFDSVLLPHSESAFPRPTASLSEHLSQVLSPRASKAEAARAEKGCVMNLERFSGVVDYSPADQVATFRAGTSLHDVQGVLLEHGQCIPLAFNVAADLSPWIGGFDCPIGELIGLHLPHGNEARFGNWRDWILGMKVVLSDGSVVQCGSHAVKNVAGYDLQRLFVGARGSLGCIVEATVRCTPLAALRKPETEIVCPSYHGVNWIQRAPIADAERLAGEMVARGDEVLHAIDHETGTLWLKLADGELPLRVAGDWVLDIFEPGRWLSETQIHFMKRTKSIFDPVRKFNEGEWGFM